MKFLCIQALAQITFKISFHLCIIPYLHDSHMFKGIGVSENKWINFGNVLESSSEQQAEFITSLKQEIQRL